MPNHMFMEWFPANSFNKEASVGSTSILSNFIDPTGSKTLLPPTTVKMSEPG
eukprot:CAMPEP_0194048048 /NCGR_PEP_ID=MMETSP0009_2-20130614/26691_1 /TAXON_ID=210454 /ORGANISM="Grammatophora oceanica, Strain CCMP 410" /LENGTH=51 /DNA_ID=CAMNT_0038693845 /DNA_START=297 /DNA_END=449 /DNA_ORIENTATION=-